MNGKTKPKESMETALSRIAQRSKREPNAKFNWLMQHYSKRNLYECFKELDGKKAIGVDGVTKEEYGQHLTENLESLVQRLKTLSYRPQPVKEVLIPKDGNSGQKRPLGISVFEDKIIQLMTSKLLESIYEPLFRDNSFGFRPGKNCHSAIKKVRERLYKNNHTVIIDVDLKNFFGTIDHGKLIALLQMKIKDETFIRYIVRMLKAGVLGDRELRMTDEGCPQGNVASPILANIFAHYAVDIWFNDTVKRYTKGKTDIYRYCDDIIICCENETDAIRIRKSLIGRLNRFGLELNQEKTQIVIWDKLEHKYDCFDFLGFTFYLKKSRKGFLYPAVKTSKKKFRIKLKRVSEWCKKNRNKYRLRELWKTFRSKLKGHLQYYGVSTNLVNVKKFVSKAVRIFFKWINRRSQRRSFNWNKFNKFLKLHPLPIIKMYHSLF